MSRMMVSRPGRSPPARKPISADRPIEKPSYRVTRITLETPMPCFLVTIRGHSSLPGGIALRSESRPKGSECAVKLGKKYLGVGSYVLWIGKSFPNLSFIVPRPHSRSASAG